MSPFLKTGIPLLYSFSFITQFTHTVTVKT